FIIYLHRGVKTRMDMWALPMFGEKKEYQLLNSPFDEQTPQLSPDGRWLAYPSDETGNLRNLCAIIFGGRQTRREQKARLDGGWHGSRLASRWKRTLFRRRRRTD